MKSELQKTSFGLINKKWNLIPFENITLNQQNGLYKPKEFQGKGIKIIKMGNQFGHPRIYNQDMDRYDLTPNELKKFQLNYDDLLFSRRSLVFEGAGECSIIKEEKEPLIFESSIIRVTLKKEIASPDFFFYFFQSHLGKQIIRSINQGTSVAGITGFDLKKILVPLPNITEQKTIIQIFIKIDDLIEKIQNQNKILEQITQAIFKSWFVDFDGITEFEDSELGKIPKGWKIDIVENIFRLEYGKHLPAWERKKGNIPVFGSGGLTGVHDKSFVKGPGVIVGRAGKIGSDSIYYSHKDFFPIETTFYVKTKNEYFITYLYFFLKKVPTIDTGSSVPNISRANIHNLEIIIPPTDLIKNFDIIIQKLFFKFFKNNHQIEILEKFRGILLPKLMSGEIRV